MKARFLLPVLLLALTFSAAAGPVTGIRLKDINGRPTSLQELKGRAFLIVNVASRCGQTPQYASLERLHRQFKARGLVVAGFPSNDFGEQEPGTEQEIREFCTTNYQVTFPLFAKVRVRSGPGQHPLYAALTGKDSAKPGEVGWNFEKILVDQAGTVLARFSSSVEPDEPEVVTAIEKALAAR